MDDPAEAVIRVDRENGIVVDPIGGERRRGNDRALGGSSDARTTNRGVDAMMFPLSLYLMSVRDDTHAAVVTLPYGTAAESRFESACSRSVIQAAVLPVEYWVAEPPDAEPVEYPTGAVAPDPVAPTGSHGPIAGVEALRAFQLASYLRV